MSEEMLGRVGMLQARDGRHHGPLRAVVHDNADPLKRCHLRLVIPDLSGVKAPHPAWVEPALGRSTLDLPEKGDVVWVLQLDADLGTLEDHLMWLPGWVIEGALPALLKTHYPKRRGLVTPSGHALYFDDSDGDDGEVVLRHRGAARLVLGVGGADAEVSSGIGGKVKLQGGGREASGKGHAVHVTIPVGTVVVGFANGAAVMNSTPIRLDGEIDEGEADVEIPG